LPARVAYERLLFYGISDIDYVLLKKSYCLKAEGKFYEAFSTLQRADLFNVSDSLKAILYNEKALVSFLAGKSDLTLSILQEFRYYFPGNSTPLSDALEILALNQQKKWVDAEKKFISFVERYDINGSNLYNEGNLPRLKNPTKAETLSFIIPGSGQLYAGYPGQAFTSVLIQCGLVAFTVYSFVNGYYVSGAFTGVGLFSFFYNGGAGHARELAEKRNTEQLLKFNEKVKTVLEKAIKK